MNILAFVLFSGCMFLMLGFVLLRYTSLPDLFRDEISVTQEDVVRMADEIDSLRQSLHREEVYRQDLMDGLFGNIKEDTLQQEDDLNNNNGGVQLAERNRADSLMRLQMLGADGKGSLMGDKRKIEGEFFFDPVKGQVSNLYSDEKGHFGLDILCPPKTQVQSVLDGRILFSGWTSEDGHVIVIAHENGLISVYKHNNAILQKIGNKVKAGDVVALSGTTGEGSTGPHLHFELWKEGEPIDPLKFIGLE